MRFFNVSILTSIIVVAAGIVLADTPVPHQKLGLWQSVTMMTGHSFTAQSCIDAATETKMSAFSSQMRNKKCKSSQVTHNMDGSWTSTSTCEFRPGVMRTTRAVITGDFNSKFTIEMRSDAGGAPEMTMTDTWIGACKPGMRGGDVIMSDGTKMNVLDGAHGPH